MQFDAVAGVEDAIKSEVKEGIINDTVSCKIDAPRTRRRKRLFLTPHFVLSTGRRRKFE